MCQALHIQPYMKKESSLKRKLALFFFLSRPAKRWIFLGPKRLFDTFRNPRLNHRSRPPSPLDTTLPPPLYTFFFFFNLGRQTEFRAVVTGLPQSASWQDLKDHMRKVSGRVGKCCSVVGGLTFLPGVQVIGWGARSMKLFFVFFCAGNQKRLRRLHEPERRWVGTGIFCRLAQLSTIGTTSRRVIYEYDCAVA